MSMKYNTHNRVSRQWNVCSAAAVGRIDILKSLVAKGADLNAVHGKGTPLYHALLHNQLRCAEYLLQNGAEITGSHYVVAYERNFESAVYLLCQYGAPKSWAAETAIRNGNRNKLRELLSRSEDVDSEYGWGDLLGQAIYRNNGMVDLLFECGATCKCSDIGKALGSAVRKCDASMLEMLLMRGADANAVVPNYSGDKSLILLSAENKFTDGMKLLFQYGANGACSDSAEALACAIRERNLEMMQLLLSHGANGACFDSAAALACAIKERNLEMMQLLLSHGADANGRRYSGGITLLELAELERFDEGAKLLIQYRSKKKEHSQQAHGLAHFLHTGLGWLFLLFIIFLLYSC